MHLHKSLVALITSTFLFSSSAFAATYEIDPEHSSVEFKVRHLAISSVGGRFLEFAGTFNYDSSNLAASKTETAIKVATIDTRQKKRDDHLRSPDFLDAAKFPEIKFVSKEVQDATAGGFKLVGDLSIRGVTKPVTLDVEVGGTTKDMYGKERAAFTASTKINRKDFGVSWSKLLDNGALVVGDEVTITIEIEGIKKA